VLVLGSAPSSSPQLLLDPNKLTVPLNPEALISLFWKLANTVLLYLGSDVLKYERDMKHVHSSRMLLRQKARWLQIADTSL
jgi:hypothetical protein